MGVDVAVTAKSSRARSAKTGRGASRTAKADRALSPAKLLEAVPAVPFVYRYVHSMDHGFKYIGPQCRRLLGISDHALVKNPAKLWPVTDDLVAYESQFIRSISLGRRAKFAGRFRVGRGQIKWLELTAEPIKSEQKERLFTGTIADIDDAKRIQIEFETMRERIGRAQEIAEFGWYDFNVKEAVIDYTPEFASKLGLPSAPSGRLSGAPAEKFAEMFRSIVHPDDRDRFQGIISDTTWLRTEFDFRIVKASGEIRNLFIRIHRTTDREGKRERDFGVILDITERKRLEENLRALASTDALTGVPNRRTFESAGRREMERARRYAKPFTVIAIDIDFFKKVNDTYGHDIGDAVLKEVAKVCAAQLRGTDVFARLGGEEFAALLPETELKSAAGLAERLRQAVAVQPIFTAKGPLVVTVSLGLAEYAAPDTGLDHVLKRADEALYVAKRNGRNRVEHAPPPKPASQAAE